MDITITSRGTSCRYGTNHFRTVARSQQFHLPGTLRCHLDTDVVGSKLRHFRFTAKTVRYFRFHLTFKEVDKVSTVHGSKQRAKAIGHIFEKGFSFLGLQRTHPDTSQTQEHCQFLHHIIFLLFLFCILLPQRTLQSQEHISPRKRASVSSKVFRLSLSISSTPHTSPFSRINGTTISERDNELQAI